MNTAIKVAAITGAVALLAMPQAVQAAGFSNFAQSATSTGMGGIATANPDEPNTSFYNPAAMTFKDGFNVYVGPTLIAPSSSYESVDGSITTNTEAAVFPPPNFNLVVPFAENYAVGLGVTLPYGLAINWPEDWHGKETFQSQALQTVNINPNFAYRFSDIGLSIGVGAQIFMASIEQKRATIPRDDHEFNVVLGGSGNGFGGNLGIMYQPAPEYTIGLNYRSAVRINADGNIHFSNVEGTPFESRLVDQTITTGLTLPHTISAGFGWKPTEKLFIGLDVNYQTWSDYDEIEIEFSVQSPEGEPGETTPSTVIRADYEDAVAIRVGGEYEVFDDFKARFGFAYDMTPVPDSTVGPSLPDNDRIVGALGVGYTWNSIRGDLGYQYVMALKREIRNGNVDGDYQTTAHVIGINVGYGF